MLVCLHATTYLYKHTCLKGQQTRGRKRERERETGRGADEAKKVSQMRAAQRRVWGEDTCKGEEFETKEMPPPPNEDRNKETWSSTKGSEDIGRQRSLLLILFFEIYFPSFQHNVIDQHTQRSVRVHVRQLRSLSNNAC